MPGVDADRVLGRDVADDERLMLTETVEFLNGEVDVVENAFEEALPQCLPGVNSYGDAAMIAGSLEGAMAATSVGFLETESLQDGDQFAGGQNGEFLTAHAWRGPTPESFRRTPPVLSGEVHRL